MQMSATIKLAAAQTMDVTASMIRTLRAQGTARVVPLMVAHVASSAIIKLTVVLLMVVAGLLSFMTTAMGGARKEDTLTVGARVPVTPTTTVHAPIANVVGRTTVVRMVAGAQLGRGAAAGAIND